MIENGICVQLAGIVLNIQTEYDFPTLAPYIVELPAKKAVSAAKSVQERRHLFAKDASEALVEYTLLSECVGRALLPFDRCVFHGVSFLWRGKAWIFTAPSGTGKTTQYILWSARYGREVSVMNGDKPVLEWRGDGTIQVHPSPWRGKEGLGSMTSAPLGGIILLSQGQENSIRLLTPREAVRPLFRQFLFSPRDEEGVCLTASLEHRLLSAVPVWLLTNRGDEASAELAHDTLLAYEEEHS